MQLANTAATPHPRAVDALRLSLESIIADSTIVTAQAVGRIAPGPIAASVRDRLTKMSLASGDAGDHAASAATTLDAIRFHGVEIPTALSQAVHGVGLTAAALHRGDGYLRGIVDAGVVPTDTLKIFDVVLQAAGAAEHARQAIAALDRSGWKGGQPSTVVQQLSAGNDHSRILPPRTTGS